MIYIYIYLLKRKICGEMKMAVEASAGNDGTLDDARPIVPEGFSGIAIAINDPLG